MTNKGGSKLGKFDEEDFFGAELKSKAQQPIARPLIVDPLRKSTPARQTFDSLLNDTPKSQDQNQALGKSQELDKSRNKTSPLSVTKTQTHEGFTSPFSQSPSITISKNLHAENSKETEPRDHSQTKSHSFEINYITQSNQQNSPDKQNETLKSENEQWMKEKEALISEKNNLKNLVDAAENKANEQERLMAQLRKEIDSLHKESKRKNQQTEQQVRKLEEKLKALTAEGADISTKNKVKLNAFVSELVQGELITLQSALQEAFKVTISAHLESFNHLSEEQQTEISKHYESEVEKHLKILQSEIESKAQAKKTSDDETDYLKEKIESLEESVGELSQKLEDESKQKTELEQILANLREDITNLKQNLEKSTEENKNLTKSLQVANTEKDEIAKTLRNQQEELEALTGQRENKKAAPDDKDEVSKLKKAIEELNRQLKAVEEEKSTTISDYTDALVKKEEELEDAKATLEDYRELTKNKEVLIRDLEKRLEENEKQLLNQKAGGKSAQNSENNQLQNEIDSLKKIIKESEQQVSVAFRNAFAKRMNKLNDSTKNYNFEGAFNQKTQSQDKIPIAAFLETLDIVLDEFVASLKKTNTENNSSDTKGEAKIQELQEIIDDLTEQRKMFSEELRLKDAEIHELQEQIRILQDQEQHHVEHTAKIQEDANVISELSIELENHKLKIDELETQLETKNYQVETLQNGLTSMQSLLEESQQASELLLKRADFEMKKIRNEYEEASRKIESLQSFREKFEATQKEIYDRDLQIKELESSVATLEQENKHLKTESAKLENKYKNDSLYKENLVDKRVIGKFFVNYFDMNTTYHTKLQILETLSSILSFSEEDRKKVGLHRESLKIEAEKEKDRRKSTEIKAPAKVIDIGKSEEEKKDSAETPTKANESSAKLKDKFLNFLLEDEI